MATEREEDFEHRDDAIKKDKKGLEGCKLTLERVPYCSCILVSGLSSKTTTDAIKFYFENPRKGCGEEPSKIELQQDLGTAILHFKDHSVLDILLEKHHVLDEAELKLEPFYPILERENETTKIEVDPDVMAYITKNYDGELRSVLDNNAIELQWIPKGTSAVITENNTEACSEVKCNKGKAVVMLSGFLENFERKVVTVDCNLWKEVTEGLHKKIDTKDERYFALFRDEASYSITIVSKKKYTIAATKQIEMFIQEVTEDRHIKNSIEEHTEEDISSEQLAVLKISKLIDHLQESYQYTSISIDDEKGILIIQSPKNKLPEITAEVLRFLMKIDKQSVRLPGRILEVLLSPKGIDYLCNEFKNENVFAVLISAERKSKNEAWIFAIDSDHSTKAVKLVRSVAKEKAIRLQDESMPQLKSRKWKELVAQHEEQLVVRISFEAQSKTLWISGIEKDAIKCYKNVKDYIDKCTILHDFVDVSSGSLRFLFKVWNDKIKKIEQELSDSFLKIEPNHKNKKITLSGNKNGIKVGKEKLVALIEKVRHETITVEKPGMTKFFKSNQGSKQIKIVESDCKCAVELFEGTSELMADGMSSSSPRDDIVNNCKLICSYTTPEGKKPVPRPVPPEPKYEQGQIKTSATIPDDGTFSTPEGISISVKIGDIAQDIADVLVNTTGKHLNLQDNACAKSFSKVAGPKLQEYCNAIAPIQVGDIGVTLPGNLRSKYVFHAVCGDWQSGSGEKILREIITKCLNEAEKQGAKSISIPAIGTGALGFPRDVVARISFDEVVMFSLKTQSSSLKQVRFVVYSLDPPTVQSFQNEITQRISSSRRDNLVINPIEYTTSNSKPPTRKNTRPVKATERKPTFFEIKFGKLSVQIQRGDITRETTDAIAMLSNSRLDFENQGAAWNAIIRATCQVITMRRSVNSLVNHKLPIPHGQTVIVPAGDLMVRKLIICTASDSKKSSKISENLVACLKAAEEQEFNSVSFPAVGTGNLGLSPKECANVMFLAAKKFSKTNPRSVQQIRIIAFQESMMNDLISAMGTCSAKANKKPNPLWKFIKKNISFLKKADKKGKKVYIEDLEMSLHVYSGSPSNLNAAVRAINDIMNEKSVLQKIKLKEVVSCLEEAQMNEINSLEQQFDCKVTIEQHNCLITVAGLSEDVLQASAVIHDILHKIVEAKHERTKAESIAKDVQWQYDTDDVFTSYTVEANAKIETAFVNKEESVTFVDNGEEFTIAFDNMIEISSTTEGVSSHTNVKRKDLRLGTVSLPDNWDALPKNVSGVDKAFHLVDLDPISQEYFQVKSLFSKTCLGNIARIRRVQNPIQYKLYSIRKQEMDDKTGSNEKQLFHGTATENCESINQNGFNRSYCGKNATMYGAGVYFAVNAKYSAKLTYSPADSRGMRYMYLARVLTGEYTRGNETMIVPPPKNPSQPNDMYDTVVNDPTNPGIFVVFKDGQAYPEYLIEFTLYSKPTPVRHSSRQINKP